MAVLQKSLPTKIETWVMFNYYCKREGIFKDLSKKVGAFVRIFKSQTRPMFRDPSRKRYLFAPYVPVHFTT